MDHLILGAADLDGAVAWLEDKVGVRAVMGGAHPGRGTRNALLSLGGRQYLEILAPDPAQTTAAPTTNLRELENPRLIGWAALAHDIDALANTIRAQGVAVSGPFDGSRARPDGRTLRWRVLAVQMAGALGSVDPIPFFIQWSADSVHPSRDSPAGCRLTELEFRSNTADDLNATLKKIGIDATVTSAETAGISATLQTPKGRVVIY